MMTEHPVQFHSLRLVYGWVFVALLLTLLGGYYFALWNIPVVETNLVLTLVWFFILPFGVSFLDFYLSWKFKRGNLDYKPPELTIPHK